MLKLLDLVEGDSGISQRSLSRELGIALGLANAYFKLCIGKGLVKIRNVPPNRYAYYLTPQGFAEKRRLTVEYLSQSFNLFRAARQQCDQLLATIVDNGWCRVAFAGCGEVGEIAVLSALAFEIEVAGFVDGRAGIDHFAGLPVAARLDALGEVDAVILTDFHRPQEAYDDLVAHLARERIFIPALMKVSPGADKGGERP